LQIVSAAINFQELQSFLRIPMTDDLIDRIYESSFVPELWPGILDALCDIADARGGVLFAAHS
jgi:hypothetical protein